MNERHITITEPPKEGDKFTIDGQTFYVQEGDPNPDTNGAIAVATPTFKLRFDDPASMAERAWLFACCEDYALSHLRSKRKAGLYHSVLYAPAGVSRRACVYHTIGGMVVGRFWRDKSDNENEEK